MGFSRLSWARIALASTFVAALALVGAFMTLHARAAVASTTWQATVGAQSSDKAIQALAFLPNDMTVDVGDTITWTFPAAEIHTLTFGVPPGPPPAFTTPQTCNAATSSTNQCAWDGTHLVTSGTMMDGQSYAVAFTTPGSFKFLCLVHSNMTGTVHVQAAGTAYPHDQTFYTQQGQQQSTQLLAQGTQDANAEQTASTSPNTVTIGAGFATSTSGGLQAVSINRFYSPTLSVNVGQTVTFTALDPFEPHTVTIGADVQGPPFTPVGLTGPGKATLSSPYPTLLQGSPTVNSGFLGARPPVPAGQGETFQLTFNAPGTYKYYCTLHDDLGMTGTVVVH